MLSCPSSSLGTRVRFTVGKAKVVAMKARLFARLGERWMARRSDAIHPAGAQEEQEYAGTAAALAETSRDRRVPV